MSSFLKTAACAALFVAPVLARAELVWHNASGWTVAGEAFRGDGDLTLIDKAFAINLLNLARRAEEDSPYFAKARYRQVAESYPTSQYAAEARFRIAVILAARASFADAYEEFEAVVRKFPEYPRFDKSVEARYRIAVDMIGGRHPRFFYGLIPWFISDNDPLKYLQGVHDAAPYGPFGDRSLFERGKFAMSLDNSEEAISSFDRLINDYPHSTYTPLAYMLMGEIYAGRVEGPFWDQGSTRDALGYYRDFVDQFPDDPQAEAARRRSEELTQELARNRLELGRFYYERRNNPRAAAVFLNETITAAPGSDAAREAESILVKIRAGEDAPRKVIDYLVGRWPRSKTGDYIDAQSQADLSKTGFLDSKSDASDQPVGVTPIDPGAPVR